MKIFAVIHNYGDHLAENSVFGEGEPLWYQMADSSVLRSGNPFFVPDFDARFEAMPSVVYRIGRLGKSIAPRFASRYLECTGFAAAVVAVNSLTALREASMPWNNAVSFDRSCLLGNLEPINTLTNNKVIEVSCGTDRISYDIGALRHPIEDIVSLLSRDNTLKNGDIILAGLTPYGLPLIPGTHLSAGFESSETKIIDFKIK